jgi:predicted phage tail protein
VRIAIRDILASANNFTVEDLEHNRNGEVTSAQRMKPLGQVIGGGVFGLFALVFGGLFFLPAFSSSGRTDFLAAMLIPAIFAGIFLLVSGWMVINGLLDMSLSSISQVAGSGHKEKRTSGGKNRSTTYYYVVNGQSFQVNKTAYTALIDNLEYRAYYLPRTKKLVSIEPIDGMPGSSQYNLNN